MASCFGGTLPSGSFSRTALISLMGAESPLHNLFTSLFVACVCLFLTSALFYLPLAVLAAIIFIALKSMINIGTCVFLWKVSKLEWAQWMVAAFVTAFAGVTWGIVASIGLSILLILKHSSRPSTAVLGILPGTDIFVSLKRYSAAVELPGIKIFRFDGALTFANRDHFETRLKKMEYQDTLCAPAARARARVALAALSPGPRLDPALC